MTTVTPVEPLSVSSKNCLLFIEYGAPGTFWLRAEAQMSCTLEYSGGGWSISGDGGSYKRNSGL